MGKALVVYYSRGGTTRRMGEMIADAIKRHGVEATLKEATATTMEDLLAADAIVIGSPTYYGTMAAEIKTLIDRSVELHGQLNGKIGGAFASSANIAGGNETTILDILNALLIHGMIIQGDPKGDHYGPVAVGKIDARAEQQCLRCGERIAALVQRQCPSSS